MPLEHMTPEQQDALRRAIDAIRDLALAITERPSDAHYDLAVAMSLLRGIPSHFGP